MVRRATRLIAYQSIVLGIAVCLTTLGCRSSAAVSPADPQSATASPSPGAHHGATRVSWNGAQRVTIDDPRFNLTAYTLEIPSGWKFAGQIVSPPGCHGMANSLDFTAVGQDGITGVVQLPPVKWIAAVGSGPLSQRMAQQCPPVSITTASGFLLQIAIPNMHPGAKVEALLPLDPEDQASVARQLEQLRQQSANSPSQSGPTSQTLDGGRVRIRYMLNGQPVEEIIAATVNCKQGQQQGKTCFTNGSTVTRAPEGQLDAVAAQPAIRNLIKSVQFNPQWSQRVTQESNRTFQNFEHRQQGETDEMARGARAFNAQLASSTASSMAADRARQGAIDRSAHNTANYALDRRDYVDPNTGRTITASSEYNHQWINSNGDTLVQTDDPNLDPNGSINPVQESWIELVPK